MASVAACTVISICTEPLNVSAWASGRMSMR
jgi:hypothetical protein